MRTHAAVDTAREVWYTRGSTQEVRMNILKLRRMNKTNKLKRMEPEKVMARKEKIRINRMKLVKKTKIRLRKRDAARATKANMSVWDFLEKYKSKWYINGKGCRIWTGLCDYKYGRPRMGLKMVYRIVIEMYRGPRPEGKECSHTCREKKCIEPEHLLWETQEENRARG